MHGWHPAPYPTKAETDANFAACLNMRCVPEHAIAVRLGVGTHNVFDIAIALKLRQQQKSEPYVTFEMLEGMANGLARTCDHPRGMLLYAPVVPRDEFLSAMAYLVRRLDENTAPENFLRDMYGMSLSSDQWKKQLANFEQGWFGRTSVSAESHRATPAAQPSAAAEFINEPDADWTQPAQRTALYEAIAAWQPLQLPELPGHEALLQCAQEAQSAWAARGAAERAQILNAVADRLSAQRFQTVACMQAEGKKAVSEADGEVSEACDFARYYARTFQIPAGVQADPLGIVAVVSPWNFPYAIPAGGMLAALMAGNSVVFKPARVTAQIGWWLVQQLWAAGIPREVLQFYPCDDVAGRALITDPRIAAVVLTGSYATAQKFLGWRPGLRLFAETSGKNAIVITGQSDRELAIKDLVRSAFGHSGQKCSAASLGILEAEVYDDPDFRRQLRDAAASLPAGPARDLRSMVTPLVVPPGEDLRRALTTLEPGEEWLLAPRLLPGEPDAWTPGIRLGVQPGSWFHRTECFGPVLGLMRAESLEQSTEWQNATDFGLTAGLHSLDPAEIAWWQERVLAGNLYINRGTTGAVVQRQPFGGWKRSCLGPGAKAGGPNYVRSFCEMRDLAAVEEDYCEAWQNHFSTGHDPAGLHAERNTFRYRTSRGVFVFLEAIDPVVITLVRRAAEIAKTTVFIYVRSTESDDNCIKELHDWFPRLEIFRTLTLPSEGILRAAHAAGYNWIHAPMVASGRIELTRWVREQAVSETRHRHGHIRETAAPATAPAAPPQAPNPGSV